MLRHVHIVCRGLLLLALAVSGRADEPPGLSLGAAVDQALARNLGLKVRRYDRTLAAAGLEEARAAFLPVFGLGAAANEQRSAAAASELEGSSQPTSEGLRWGADVEQRLAYGTRLQLGAVASQSESDSSFATLNPASDASAEATLAQPLLRGAGRLVNRAEILRGEIAVRRADLTLSGAVMDLLSRVEQAYFRARLAQMRLQIHAASLAAAESLLAETLEKRKQGVQTDVDVMQAEVGVAQRRETLILDQQEIADAEDQLRLLLHGALDGKPLGPLEDLPDAEGPAPDPDASGRAAFARQPEYLLQRQLIEEQELNADLASREHLPTLDLNARGTYSGRDEAWSDAWRGVRRQDGYGWQVDLALSVPWGLRDTGARRARARAQLEQAEWDLQRVEQELLAQVRSACRAVAAGRERVRATQLARQAAERQLEQERSRFDAGLVTVRQVLDVEEEVEQSRLRELEARRDTLAASVRLSQLEGGLLERHGLEWREVDPEAAAEGQP